jgi:D-alanine-D-alanine ligase
MRDTKILQQLKVWVLAPHVVTNDANIDYYYDFSQSIAEYTKTFAALQIEWIWQPVTMQNFIEIINAIADDITTKQKLAFNLCDGDELNGAPGVSVIHYLEKKQIKYTGASAFFYDITTSKIPMKKAFDHMHVATAAWEAIANEKDISPDIFKKVGSPILLKPAVSGGSMGVGVKNVVHNLESLQIQVNAMFAGYGNWKLTTDGIIAEAFITGPEFTVFIVGNYWDRDNAIIYTPVERAFHKSLPKQEQFLSFDRLWEIYEEEDAMPNDENFYEYQLPAEKLLEPLKELAWQAYVACKGNSYTRVDLRIDETTNKLFVLEVNAQCGLSEDEDYTSIGAIIKASHTTFTDVVSQILLYAIN